MAVTLTPADVETLCGVTVTASQIATADQLCYDETGYTFTQHNTLRQISEAIAEQAWAITTANVSAWFGHAGDDRAVQSESQGDYSYTVDTAERVRTDNASPITGPVRRLLRINQATWSHIGEPSRSRYR